MKPMPVDRMELGFLFDDLEEFLDEQADVDDGQPNRAMNLARRIREIRPKVDA